MSFVDLEAASVAASTADPIESALAFKKGLTHSENTSALSGASLTPPGLGMRSRCERCGTELLPDGGAYICSYECTFCVKCAHELSYRCPNCAGELVLRPRRAATSNASD